MFPDDMPEEIRARLLEEFAEHSEGHRQYKDATRLYRYRVRIVQAPGDSWLYLANTVTVQAEPGDGHMGMYKVTLNDAWTRAEAARLLDEVEAVCMAYTIEKCSDQELSAADLLAGEASS